MREEERQVTLRQRKGGEKRGEERKREKKKSEREKKNKNRTIGYIPIVSKPYTSITHLFHIQHSINKWSYSTSSVGTNNDYNHSYM
jgi:hypothetical protein